MSASATNSSTKVFEVGWDHASRDRWYAVRFAWWCSIFMDRRGIPPALANARLGNAKFRTGFEVARWWPKVDGTHEVRFNGTRSRYWRDGW